MILKSIRIMIQYQIIKLTFTNVKYNLQIYKKICKNMCKYSNFKYLIHNI